MQCKYVKGPGTFLMILMLGCSSSGKKELSKKEKLEQQITYMKEVRPLLKSDEFPYMKCTELGELNVDKPAEFDADTWKGFGVIELREQAFNKGANILTSNHLEVEGKHSFNGKFFKCTQVNKIGEVEGPIGMCASSEERVFTLNYPDDDTRDFGREMIKQKIRYHGLTNHYKTFSVKDVKYSFTKKRFEAKGYFFDCL